jgi:hypothetical protein
MRRHHDHQPRRRFAGQQDDQRGARQRHGRRHDRRADTHVTTISDNDTAAIKSAAGFWGGNISAGGAFPASDHSPNGYHGTLATVLNDVADICNAQYVTGYHMLVSWSFVEDDIQGHFSDDSRRGFPFFDRIRDELAACGKKLDVTVNDYTPGYEPSYLADWFPAYLIQQVYVLPGFGNYTQGNWSCATPCPSGGVVAPPDGSVATLTVWDPALTARKVAVVQAYCNRYDNDPTFVSFSMQYDSNEPVPSWQAGQITEAMQLNTASRAACHHMNLRLGITFFNGGNSVGNQIIANNLANKSDLRGTDVFPPEVAGKNGTPSASFAQAFFLGAQMDGNGNFTQGLGTDQRGVSRWSEEIEASEMCTRWSVTPAQFMNYLTNPTDGFPPHYPNKIVVHMLTGCPPGYGWPDWKVVIAARQGKLYDGHSATLRTPHELNTTYCETGVTPCQE